jgi:hypothetical protein
MNLVDNEQLIHNRFIRDINVIPYFIQKNRQSHLQWWDIMATHYEFIGGFICDKIHHKSVINQLCDRIFADLDEMFDFNENLYFEYKKYTRDLCEYYLRKCEMYELYEGAENFNRFLIIYKIK